MSSQMQYVWIRGLLRWQISIWSGYFPFSEFLNWPKRPNSAQLHLCLLSFLSRSSNLQTLVSQTHGGPGSPLSTAQMMATPLKGNAKAKTRNQQVPALPSANKRAPCLPFPLLSLKVFCVLQLLLFLRVLCFLFFGFVFLFKFSHGILEKLEAVSALYAL